MASQDPHLGDRPDLPSSQHQQMQGRTQARAQSESEREHMPVEPRTPQEARRAARVTNAGRDQPAGMGLGNAARPTPGEGGNGGTASREEAPSAPPSPPDDDTPRRKVDVSTKK